MITTMLTIAAIGLITIGSVALYLLPLIIGLVRRVPDIGSVVAVNILLGWTFIGWAAALAMALRSPSPAQPSVQVVQNFPPPPSWPGQLASAGWAGPPGPPPPRPGTPPPLALPPHLADPPDLADHLEQG